MTHNVHSFISDVKSEKDPLNLTKLYNRDRAVVFEKIKEINKDGTTVVVVGQNARMALEYADRGYLFQIGEIFLEGSGAICHGGDGSWQQNVEKRLKESQALSELEKVCWKV